jgi:pyruvate dehydrogenase E1 component
MGGYLPLRDATAEPLPAPDLQVFDALLKGSGEREFSTTMAFVRALAVLLRDKALKERIVPIVADEARTFGMEGLFRQLGIYSHVGQLYEPEDSDQLMYYKEAKAGQVLQEGITEAGAMSSWIAAATSYANSGVAMIPFFIYYSMFGFQRIGDLAWAAGDQRARGFLLGGTSGRTTLNGEGLQHEDGHSHIMSATIPNCVSYDPSFAYEVAVILRDGIFRMYQQQEDIFYYITLLNENYQHPPMPEGVEDGIRKGMYLFREGPNMPQKVQLMGSGSIMGEVIAAAEILQTQFGVACDLWSAPSFTELARDGNDVVRHNRLHPEQNQRVPYVTQCLQGHRGPVIAATDYIRAYAEQIRAFVPNEHYTVLGTDGYGRSDTRANLRRFFEVDRYHVAYSALSALYDMEQISRTELVHARKQLGIDTSHANPLEL